MKIDVAPLQHLTNGCHLVEIIFIQRHGVSIILIIRSNMACINVLTSTHNLSIDRKFGVHPHARLKSLMHLIWKVEWNLFNMRIVYHSIFFINKSQRI